MRAGPYGWEGGEGELIRVAGGGSAGAATYWEVRKEKMLDQARAAVCTDMGACERSRQLRLWQTSDLLKGCVFYINGSTGPRVSNLQLQHMITSNGGRFLLVYDTVPWGAAHVTQAHAVGRGDPYHCEWRLVGQQNAEMDQRARGPRIAQTDKGHTGRL